MERDTAKKDFKNLITTPKRVNNSMVYNISAISNSAFMEFILIKICATIVNENPSKLTFLTFTQKYR